MSNHIGGVIIHLGASFGQEEDVPHSPLKRYKIAIYCEKDRIAPLPSASSSILQKLKLSFRPEECYFDNANIPPKSPYFPSYRCISPTFSPKLYPHIQPFLANSTLLANSLSFHPFLLTQTALPSPSSNLSSCAGHAHGQ